MGLTEKTTTRITSIQTNRRLDLEMVLSNEEQDRILYTITFILLVILLISTYIW